MMMMTAAERSALVIGWVARFTGEHDLPESAFSGGREDDLEDSVGIQVFQFVEARAEPN